MAQEQRELLEKFIADAKANSLSDAEQRPLWRSLQRGRSPELKARLHAANLYKVAKIVLKRFRTPTPHLLDMIQNAAVEMLAAIDRYDLDKDVPFGAYIEQLVIRHATRTYRQLSSPVRFAHTHGDVEVPRAAEVEHVESVDMDRPGPDEAASQREQLAEVAAAVRCLSTPERRVWAEFARGLPPDEIAKALGMKVAQVEALITSAMEYVRNKVVRQGGMAGGGSDGGGSAGGGW